MNEVNKQPGLYHYDTGFVIQFPNGYAASIRWGETNYAVNINPDHTNSHMAALDAEAAAFVWDLSEGDAPGFYHVDGFSYPDGDDVLPCLSPNHVAEFIYKVASLDPVNKS